MTAFLVVAFDGLRPDMVEPALMPNLHRFRSAAVTFANHRAAFPSDTRANVASLVSGAYPGRHGVLGNAYYDRAAHPDAVFNTMDADLIEQVDRARGGRLFEVESLGDMLGRSGRTMAVIGAASRGTTRLIHHTVRRYPQHLCLACHYEDASCPEAALAEIVARFGPLPPAAKPDIAALDYATDVFLQHVWPTRRPDLTVIWFNEPDTSYHWFGVRSPEALAAIAAADAQFGRILEWWERVGLGEGVQLMTMSDHGHISTMGRIDVGAALAAADFRVGANFAGDAELVVVPASSGQIYVRDDDPGLTAAVVDFLMAQNWCGNLFTPGRNAVHGRVPGTLARALVFADHERSPAIAYTLRVDDEPDRYGLRGRCYFDSGSAFASMHGGLHPKELESLAMIGGTLFKQGEIVTGCTGVVDLAPTIMAALGLPRGVGIQGRVLNAALRAGGGDAEETSETLEAGSGAYAQTLERTRVGTTAYIEGGWTA
jgi:predicted AlkP superfamily pyrophosphatase or phosphodiesterase